jgi:hypothetical protein
MFVGFVLDLLAGMLEVFSGSTCRTATRERAGEDNRSH